MNLGTDGSAGGIWICSSITTYLVARLGSAGVHVHVRLLAGLHEDIGDDSSALCGVGVGALDEG